MDSWRAFRFFCTSVLSRWISLLTGGFAIAGLGILEHFTGLSVPWTAYALLVITFFASACFLAFKDQFVLAGRLQTNLSSAVELANRTKEKDRDLHALQENYRSALDLLSSAKAEIHDLQQTVGPPYPLNPSQRKALVELLANTPAENRFPVEVCFPGLGGGAAPARAFARAITDGGWQAKARSHGALNPDNFGITISLSDEAFAGQEPWPERAVLLNHLFGQAGVKFRIGRMGPNFTFQGDRFLLIVADG